MLAFAPRQWYCCENANTLIRAAILKSGHPTYGLRYCKPIIYIIGVSMSKSHIHVDRDNIPALGKMICGCGVRVWVSNIYLCVCPTHVLKNHYSLLHTSRRISNYQYLVNLWLTWLQQQSITLQETAMESPEQWVSLLLHCAVGHKQKWRQKAELPVY